MTRYRENSCPAAPLESCRPSMDDPNVCASCGLERSSDGDWTGEPLDPERAGASSGKPGCDVTVYWRGSPSDLATDLEPLLTLEQLQELACELALKWRERRLKGGG